MSEVDTSGLDFIRAIVKKDVADGKHGGAVRTRFPPEPNGYLHIGHAKAVCVDFGVAEDFGGTCNLRFDDTNPAAEEMEYVEAIQRDIRWLGFDWGDRLYFASDYFERMYECALHLIRKGKAYVDELSPEEIREYRGSLTEPGRDSPFRDRPVEESLDLFERMRAGEFEEGACVLRARIDMAHPNMNMRDPTIYRIRKLPHVRTGTKWCIYPMYDFAHPLEDAFEEITHSLCSLEFEHHRPLYDWFIRECGLFPSRQIEFARLNLTYTVTSKRKLLRLVEAGAVEGWDDPRMPTLAGLRRRGYSPASIRGFCARVGVAKADSTNEIELLEHCLREDLNKVAPRAMAVLRPLEVRITNWPEGKVEWLEAVNNPEDPSAGTREIPFTGRLLIERDDFMEDPPKKFYRLAPGREVRLRYAYFLRCDRVVKDGNGEVLALECSYDPETRGGKSPDGRKVKATIHWVSAEHAIPAEVRLYGHLFTTPEPGRAEDILSVLNEGSVEILEDCRLEPSLAEAPPGSRWQFERLGYFCAEQEEHRGVRPRFHRAVTLRDEWAKLRKKGQAGG